MSKFVPVEGISKRPKRASRACDHCRWKRLKCSDEQKGESCMNCVIYGTKCQYTPPWSPNSGRKKDSVTKGPGVKKRSTGRNSTSPVGLDGQNSPASSFNDDSFLTDQNMLPKMANARRLAVEYTKATDPTADLDQMESRLDQYAAFLTSFSENRNSPVDALSDETGLPSQALANALLQAYKEGFEAGNISSQQKFRPQLSSQRRSRSMHEFAQQSQSPHDVSLTTLALDPLNANHHQHSNMHHHSGSPAPHSPMSPFGMEAHAHHHHLPVSGSGAGSILGGTEFNMQMHPPSSVSGASLVENVHAVHAAQHHAAQHHAAQHHAAQHHRQANSRQRPMQNGMGGTGGQLPAPRSVPQGLSLAIPGDESAHWGGPNSAPPTMMPQGFGGDPFNMM